MTRAKILIVGASAALLLTSNSAPVTIAQENAVQTMPDSAESSLLEPFGIDVRPSPALGDDELQARIEKLVAVMKQDELSNDVKKQLRAQLKADRREANLRHIAAEDQPTQPTTDSPQDQASEQSTVTEVQPPDATEVQPEAPNIEEQPIEEQPAAPMAEATAEPAPVEQSEGEAAAKQPPTAPDVETPPVVNPEAEARAVALLADKATPELLSDEMLKERVEKYRDLLRQPELSPATAKSLRQRLKTDRVALRARVAAQKAALTEVQVQPNDRQVQPAQEQTQQSQQATAQDQQDLKREQQVDSAQPPATAEGQDTLALQRVAPLLPVAVEPTAQEVPLILADQRPSQALSIAELSRRILAARDTLQGEQNYSQDAFARFRSQLQADRMELNDRLVADRNQRADIYDEFVPADNLDFTINKAPEPGELPPPNSVFAAEADDEELWNQLVSSPLEPIQQHYTRYAVTEEPESIMNRPEVRNSMPSIELDTITFGFNEAFLREEEIFDLDRIARMIERVVAAHPDEIFMIEGHTDAVGSDDYNLRLSRARAEALATALTRYYVIRPENLVTVGLGERYLKIWTPEAEEENRRVTVRRVTPLTQGYGGTG